MRRELTLIAREPENDKETPPLPHPHPTPRARTWAQCYRASGQWFDRFLENMQANMPPIADVSAFATGRLHIVTSRVLESDAKGSPGSLWVISRFCPERKGRLQSFRPELEAAFLLDAVKASCYIPVRSFERSESYS